MASKSMDSMERYPDVLPDPSTMLKRWIWKEEGNCLELISSSSNPGAERERNGINLSKNKQALLSQKNRMNASTPLMGKMTGGGTGVAGGKLQATGGVKKRPMQAKTSANLSPRPSMRVPQNITSEDRNSNKAISLLKVKEVAYEQMSQSEESIEMLDIFRDIIMTASLDSLLAVLLCYFKSYFEQMAMETKEKDKSLAPSDSERVALEAVQKYRAAAKKLLAEKYCTLILGLGSEGQHHMECGKQRKSFTRRDRYLYETLYVYCGYVVWICFRREDYNKPAAGAKRRSSKLPDAATGSSVAVPPKSDAAEEGKPTNKQIIETELGRLFRSETFNPYTRPNEKNDFKRASDLTGEDIRDVSLAPSSIRKNKRPAIKAIINQRSPVLVSLLPSSKESSACFLDRRHALDVGATRDNDTCEPLADMDPQQLKIGIIGELISGFNEMLAPFGDEDHEHEKEVDDADRDRKRSDDADRDRKRSIMTNQDLSIPQDSSSTVDNPT